MKIFQICFNLQLLCLNLLSPSQTSSQNLYNCVDSSWPETQYTREHCQISGTVVNCSHMSLSQVPDHIPLNVTILDLSNNRFQEINSSLSKFDKLQELYLANNLIEKLHRESFADFNGLLILDLQGNKLEMKNEAFPPKVFSALKSLQVLKINKNNKNLTIPDLSYPDKVLSDLENLVDLHMDGLPDKVFGPGFDQMISLRPALAAMDSVNLTHLNIQKLMSPYSPCNKVTNLFAKSLPRSLTHLTASSNGLAFIDPEVFDLLPDNLTFLDLSDNRFTFGYYLKNFSRLTNLETLVLDGAEQSYNLPVWFPQEEQSFAYQDVKVSYPIWERVNLTLPPKLKTVSLSSAGLTYKLSEFHVDPNNALENLKLDGNKIQSLKGPITGLHQLKSLSLVDCYIREIHERFFENFASLEFLNLSANTFGRKVLKNGSKPIFSSLKNLRELDLSFVDLITVDKNVFEGLENLEILHLERNGIYYFEVDVNYLKKLQFVNFSFTELTGLRPQVTNFFDSIAASNNLTLDFSENPIHCYCANLEFIAWLSRALQYIRFQRLEKFKCVYEDTTEKYFHDFQDLHQFLDEECTPKVTLFFIVTSATLLLVCIIIALVVYRFRWKLKYFYFSAYLYFKSYKRHGDDKDFEFDVFVSFANEDERFVLKKLVPELTTRGLKLHIHTTNFRAGEYIATNIVNAVQCSRRTLIVVSSNLQKSQWCHFELQMANLESVHTGRPVMVFLLMESLPEDVLSREILYHIQNNTYLQLPDEVDDARVMDIFWTKLSSDLKD
ncbi:toll-like receptor 13 [Biomphalaria pfeifferi]|uniref:Toll-like receptor 13 n=1 Tax=Biomphalaria pfeifferi TaxID=112525 RepID=A0AAD8EUV1_BIOPF|nr:toll-like receptor 13 [Biomphalaria pfeifferi]